MLQVVNSVSGMVIYGTGGELSLRYGHLWYRWWALISGMVIYGTGGGP